MPSLKSVGKKLGKTPQKETSPKKKKIVQPVEEDFSSSDEYDENDLLLGDADPLSADSESEESSDDAGPRWGSKKGGYYGQFNAKDEETEKILQNQLEKNLKKASADLRPEDFDDFDPHQTAKSPKSSQKKGEVDFKLKVNYDQLSTEEKLSLLNEETPELVEMLKEFLQKIKEIKLSLQPTLDLVKDHQVNGGISFLQVKFQLLLSYLMDICFFLMLKISGFSVKSHPVVDELAKIRVILERIKPIDLKLQNQIDTLLRIANMGEGAGNLVRHRPNLAAFQQDSEDEEEAQPNANDKYLVAKSSVPYLQEKKEKREKKRLERLKSKIAKSSMMKHLQSEYMDTPEEIAQVGANLDDEPDYEELEKNKFEEDFFQRLPTKRKEEKQKKAKMGTSDFFDSLPSYNQIMVLDNMAKKKVQEEQSRVADPQDMLRQKFGAIPENEEFNFDEKKDKKKRKVELYKDIGPDDRRKLSRDILTDQGHSRQRSKDKKNSKTALRKKYSKAVSKHNSIVRPAKQQEGSYSGEKRISANVVRSKDKDKKKTLDISDWFMNITGNYEATYRTQPSHGISRDPQYPQDPIPQGGGHPYLVITNAKTKRVYKAGRFSVESIGDLIQRVEAKASQLNLNPNVNTNDNNSNSNSNNVNSPQASAIEGVQKKEEAQRKCIFEIIVRSSSAGRKSVDVAYLQGLPYYRNAVFQAASNFNGIEAISETSSPDFPNFTEKYYMDGTQGPAASISAGAGAITRVHCAFYDDETNIDNWRQTSTRQINFLDQLVDHYPMKNGYVIQPKDNSQIPEFPSDPEEVEKLLRKTKIGYHKDEEVTTSSSGRDTKIVDDPNQIIDQVFCAAMNCGQGFSGMVNSSSKSAKKKCELVLDTAYQGTLLGAIDNGRSEVVLTLIGGGVFGNSKPMIYNSILKAHERWADHPASTLKIVSLVVYSEYDFVSSFPAALSKAGIPWRVVTWEGGQKRILEQSKGK